MNNKEKEKENLLGLLMGMHNATVIRETYLRLPFGYTGSKVEQLKQILPALPYRQCYGEPFGGSGVVLLNREPSKLEIFNDRYSGITCFFRIVRDKSRLDEFLERIYCTVHSREEFIWCKNTWRNCEDDFERAARWYYTIRFAVNSKPESTFGRSVDPKVRFADRLHKSLPLFLPLAERLQTVTIENLDWRQLLTDYDREDFVWYLDPTYLGTYSGAYEFELTRSDHIELCERIQNLKGFVALSGFHNELTKEIYDNYKWDTKIVWERSTTALTQAFNEQSGLLARHGEHDTSRNKVTECLWIKE